MTSYRQLAIVESKPGVIDFKVFNPQPTLYRLDISRDGDKNVWHLSKYPFESLGLNGLPSTLVTNAGIEDLLDVLPKGWTVPEFFTAAVFFQAGKETRQNS